MLVYKALCAQSMNCSISYVVYFDVFHKLLNYPVTAYYSTVYLLHPLSFLIIPVV